MKKEDKINQTQEYNPNREAHHARHRRDKRMGGHPGGSEEGPPMGSRGNNKRFRLDTTITGSRTSRKR